MNWIGHYLCALPQPSLERSGATVVDLLRLLHHRLRPRQLECQGTGWETQALLRGMRMHQEVDRHFHRTDFFLRTQAALLEALKQAAGPPGLKRLLPAHVLAELWFDQQLVEACPQVLAQAGQDLQHARRPLGRLLQAIPGLPAAGQAGWAERVAGWQERIGDPQFGADFRSLQGPLARMDRILTGLGLRTLTAAERTSLLAAWSRLRGSVAAELGDFVARMQGLAAGREPLWCRADAIFTEQKG